MSKILFCVLPLSGHINPTIGIAQQLQKEGHEVKYACHGKKEELLRKSGLELIKTYEWGDRILRFEKQLATQKNKILSYINAAGGSIFSLYVDRFEEGVLNLVKVIEAWKPDAIVYDMNFYYAPAAAELTRLPYCTSCTMPVPLREEGMPPYGPGFPSNSKPDFGWFSANVMYGIFKGATDKIVNKVRRKLNLQTVDDNFFYPSPYLYLAYTTSLIEFKRKKLLPQVYYVGPTFSATRGDAQIPFPWEWLDNRKTLYTSMGTVNTGKVDFFNNVIEASRGQNWKTIISVGYYQDIAGWKNVPENVLIRNYVPQFELLKKVDLVITHGGSNTMLESLVNKLPLLVAPTGSDQHENAQRIVEAGAGIRINPDKIHWKELWKKINTLLETQSYKQNAGRLAADLSRCNGVQVAAALIGRLAEKKTPLLRPQGRDPMFYESDLDEIKKL